MGTIEHSVAFEVCVRSGQLPWDCGLSACENGCTTKTVEFVPVSQHAGAVEALRDLIPNASCFCDHPLRAGMGPCSKCRAEAAVASLDHPRGQ
jgi:hypothetical protein